MVTPDAAVRLALLWALSCGVSAPVLAQFSQVWAPREVVAGEPCSLYALWSGRVAATGFFVDLPEGWTIERGVALRHGYVQTPFSIEERRTGWYWITTASPLRGSFELLLNVVPGGSANSAAWSVMPAVPSQSAAEESYRITGPVQTHAPPASPTNRALRFQDQGRPIVLDQTHLPPLRRDAAFTIEAWIKTVARERIVLSTWNGDNKAHYPVELIVDTYGRIRSYHKQGSRHVSIASHRPVSDGRWHHVALVHNPDDWSTRLYLDGEPADSVHDAAIHTAGHAHHLAIGHRLDAAAEYNTVIPRFEGDLDEIRIWGAARSAQDIRTAMRKSESTREGLVVLGFDRPVPAALIRRRATATANVGTDLAFFAPARSFRGAITPLGIQLSWEAPSGLPSTYVVERSLDGREFQEVGTVAGTQESHFTFLDESVASQVVYYRLRQRYGNGLDQLTGTIKLGLALGPRTEPTARILDNYPNPFNTSTTISYEVAKEQAVNLSVWDISGQLMQTLVSRPQKPGIWQVGFSGDELPSGTYFVRLVGEDGRAQTRKILLMK